MNETILQNINKSVYQNITNVPILNTVLQNGNGSGSGRVSSNGKFFKKYMNTPIIIYSLLGILLVSIIVYLNNGRLPHRTYGLSSLAPSLQIYPPINEEDKQHTYSKIWRFIYIFCIISFIFLGILIIDRFFYIYIR
jgi:hypothetical protein